MWWYFLILLPVAVVVWLLYEWFEHTAVQYNSTTVECRKMPDKKELRICLITDLHNNRKNLKNLFCRIQEFQPELVLLAGDLVDKHKEANSHTEKFLLELNKQKIPVYYSAGNHELSLSEHYPEVWENYVNSLPEHIKFLDNRSVLAEKNKKLCITGLSLPREFYKKGRLYEESEHMPDISIPENEFHILMAHHPEYAEHYEKYRPDFIVSGHLHGGLLRLPLIGGIVSPRLRLPRGCDAGLVKLHFGAQMYVSRGLGSHTIPLRFFNRVEVNFLVLKGD